MTFLRRVLAMFLPAKPTSAQAFPRWADGSSRPRLWQDKGSSVSALLKDVQKANEIKFQKRSAR